MKHLYALLCGLLLITASPARAQTADSLRQALDHLFAPLDKAQVPGPYLAEYTPLTDRGPSPLLFPARP